MEQKFITSIEDLKQTVKVNASLPFATLYPYLEDAYFEYILPYLGVSLADSLQDSARGASGSLVFILVQRALGPLAVALASPELGVLIGDSGHTVARNDKYTVANDEKIARSENSMAERGWKNLDRLIEYLSANVDSFPEWKESEYYRRLSVGEYISNAREFQDEGKVNIQYSSLTFEQLRPLLEAHYVKLRSWIGKELDASLREEILKEDGRDEVKMELVGMIRMWAAMSVAKLYTSQMTRTNRSAPGQLEFRAVIYPLYSDLTENGNFYAEQVATTEAAISDFMATNYEALGIPAPIRFDFNGEDKKIFVL